MNHTKFPHYMGKLNKVIYSLKQALKTWFHTLTSTLKTMRFQQLKADTSLFSKVTSITIIYVFVYVEDMVITRSSEIEIANLISTLHTRFSLNYLGLLSYFLGIEVFHITNGDLLLTQGKYIRELLVKAGMENAKSITTPMTTSYTLSAHILESHLRTLCCIEF